MHPSRHACILFRTSITLLVVHRFSSQHEAFMWCMHARMLLRSNEPLERSALRPPDERPGFHRHHGRCACQPRRASSAVMIGADLHAAHACTSEMPPSQCARLTLFFFVRTLHPPYMKFHERRHLFVSSSVQCFSCRHTFFSALSTLYVPRPRDRPRRSCTTASTCMHRHTPTHQDAPSAFR